MISKRFTLLDPGSALRFLLDGDDGTNVAVALAVECPADLWTLAQIKISCDESLENPCNDYIDTDNFSHSTGGGER